MTVLAVVLILFIIAGALFFGFVAGLAVGGYFDGYKDGREAATKKYLEKVESLG